jgi:peptidoglycan/LPS O-acetylase OafA/YrhL
MNAARTTAGIGYSGRRTEIPSLTGLRAIAALWVCSLHFLYVWPDANPLVHAAKLGASGVIIFFVLSGFILGHVYHSFFANGVSATRYVHFMKLRLARIYPLHLLTLLLWTAALYYDAIRWSENDTLYTFVLNLLLVHGWGFTNTLSFNDPSWSISHEFFCYLWFPLLACLLSQHRLVALAVLCIAVLAAWRPPYAVLLSWLAGQGVVDLRGMQFAFGASMVNFSTYLVVGVALHYAIGTTPSRPVLAETALCLGLAILLWSATLPTIWQVAVVVGSGLVIVGCYWGSAIGDLLLGNRIAVFFGEISYTLYLTHALVLYFSLHSLPTSLVPWTWTALSYVCAMTLILSVVIHYGFERPARNLIRNCRSKAPFGFSRRLLIIAEAKQMKPGEGPPLY